MSSERMELISRIAAGLAANPALYEMIVDTPGTDPDTKFIDAIASMSNKLATELMTQAHVTANKSGGFSMFLF